MESLIELADAELENSMASEDTNHPATA